MTKILLYQLYINTIRTLLYLDIQTLRAQHVVRGGHVVGWTPSCLSSVVVQLFCIFFRFCFIKVPWVFSKRSSSSFFSGKSMTKTFRSKRPSYKTIFLVKRRKTQRISSQHMHEKEQEFPFPPSLIKLTPSLLNIKIKGAWSLSLILRVFGSVQYVFF